LIAIGQKWIEKVNDFIPKCATGIAAEIPELQKFKIQDRKERPKEAPFMAMNFKFLQRGIEAESPAVRP